MQGIGDGNLPVEFDPFNTPIPGQSLTDEPGNYPWEHAPKNVDPEIILERTWRGMRTTEAVEEMIYLLDAGVPAEAIGKFLASKTPKQLTDNPQGMIKELTGLDTASLTNPVKSFYYKKFQPASQKYEDLKKQYVYKPLVLSSLILGQM